MIRNLHGNEVLGSCDQRFIFRLGALRRSGERKKLTSGTQGMTNSVRLAIIISSHGWHPKAKAIQSPVREQNKSYPSQVLSKSKSSRCLTKQATLVPESKLLEMSDRNKSSRIHVLWDEVICFRPAKKLTPVYIGLHSLFGGMQSEWKPSSKKTLNRWKPRKNIHGLPRRPS